MSAMSSAPALSAMARKRCQSMASEYAEAPVTMSLGFSATAILSAAS
jgi:hypothetical protein